MEKHFLGVQSIRELGGAGALLGNIAHFQDRSDCIRSLVVNRRSGERDREKGAVAGHEPFLALGPDPALESLIDRAFVHRIVGPVRMLRMDHLVERPAVHLFEAVADQGLRCRIGEDATMPLVHDEDSHHRIVENRVQAVADHCQAHFGGTPFGNLPLRIAVEPRIVDRDCRLRSDRDDQPLVPFGEACGLFVAEEQSAKHFAGPRDHWHREIAHNRQVPLGKPVVGRAFPVARVELDIVRPEHSDTPERVVEDSGVAGHWELVEGGAGSAREAVEHEALARFVQDVVEECAELSAGELDRGVGDLLDDSIEVEVGGNRFPCLVESVEDSSLLAKRLFRLPPLDDQRGRPGDELDQLQVRLHRLARLPVIHSEGAEHSPIAGEDRDRPARPEPVCERQILEVAP